MKFKKNPALWTSTILHLVVLLGLLLVTLIEAFLPKEQPHVFEMISEPFSDESEPQSSPLLEPLPDFKLPEVPPLEIPELDIPDAVVPVEKPIEPVSAPAEPVEQTMTYEEFLKNNPIKQPKTRSSKPSKPNIQVPTINTEKFGVNLQSSLRTVHESTASTLTSQERTALQLYGDRLNGRLNRAWIKPDNLSGINLVATVVFDVSSSGRISNIRLSPRSGNASFDESVKAAFARIGSAEATPTGKGHTFTMSFKMVN